MNLSDECWVVNFEFWDSFKCTKGPFRYSWKLKTETETEKHCSKIIFKCVNSTVWPIFNEKSCWKVGSINSEICVEKVRKVKLCGYCSWIVAATVNEQKKKLAWYAWKKRKKEKLKRKRAFQLFQPNPNGLLAYYICSNYQARITMRGSNIL